MEIRIARPGELPAIMTVFTGGLLAVSAERVRTAIEAGRVFVADEDGPALGALVVAAEGADDRARIEAIAVRRGRRGQGIGTALVREAAARHGALVAEFDPGVRPFWTSIGFEIGPAAEPDRYVGTLDVDP